MQQPAFNMDMSIRGSSVAAAAPLNVVVAPGCLCSGCTNSGGSVSNKDASTCTL
jgi:hypothetical protein